MFEWENSRRNAKVVGFVDDSLVMVGDYRFWLEVTDTWNGGHYEDTDAGNPRLCVYNYRVQEDGPRWCDSVSEQHSAEWFRGQMTDSTVWGGLLDKSFVLWKIGEKPHKMGLRTEFDGCSEKVGVNRIHEWIDGKFIALGVATINSKTFGNALQTLNYGNEFCQYAVLDTVTKLITYKRLSRNLEWIKECDDVRAWNDDVYCLVLKDNPMNLYLIKNAVYVDTLLQGDPYKWSNVTKVGFAGNVLNLGNNICEIVDGKIQCVGVAIRGTLEFRQQDGASITY